jgi:hypothetical protein
MGGDRSMSDREAGIVILPKISAEIVTDRREDFGRSQLLGSAMAMLFCILIAKISLECDRDRAR